MKPPTGTKYGSTPFSAHLVRVRLRIRVRVRVRVRQHALVRAPG